MGFMTWENTSTSPPPRFLDDHNDILDGQEKATFTLHFLHWSWNVEEIMICVYIYTCIHMYMISSTFFRWSQWYLWKNLWNGLRQVKNQNKPCLDRTKTWRSYSVVLNKRAAPRRLLIFIKYSTCTNFSFLLQEYFGFSCWCTGLCWGSQYLFF